MKNRQGRENKEPKDHVVVTLNPDGISDMFGPFDSKQAFAFALELKRKKTRRARRIMHVPKKRNRERWKWDGLSPGAVCIYRTDPDDNDRYRHACGEFRIPKKYR